MPRFVRREEAAVGRRGARGAMDQNIELRELKRMLKKPTVRASERRISASAMRKTQ